MSYCRFTPDSDVYVYRSDKGIVCCACCEPYSNIYPDAAAMLAHLKFHLEKGDRVPSNAINRLELEIVQAAFQKREG